MPTKRELEVKDPAILLKRIKDAFPGLDWEEYEFLNHGWDHQVIILDRKVVFRFPNSWEYLKQLESEIEILRSLADQVTVNIPDYRYIAPDFSFAGYALIPGHELSVDYFRSFNQLSQDNLANQLAVFLSMFHGIALNNRMSYPEVYKNLKEEQKILRKRSVEYLKPKLSQVDFALSQSILDDVDDLFKQNVPIVFTHSDIASDHLLWDDAGNKLGIIDFSDMCLGDPAIDFAELYDYGEEFVKNVYSRYRGERSPGFLKRAKIYQRRVGVYLLVDSFLTNKISFKAAIGVFNNVK